jgi:aminopeptidase N
VSRRALVVVLLLLAGCSSSTASAPPDTTSAATTLTVATTPAASSSSAITVVTTVAATTTPPTTVASTTSTTVLVGENPASTLGDVYYPELGNAGIDVTHVDLALAWQPTDGVLTGTATLDITAVEPLASFHLDFIGFSIDTLHVNGQPARFSRALDDLEIVPESVIAPGAFQVTIRYSGKPEQGKDTVGRPLGWLRTNGGAYTLAEPGGAHYWFPSNDHPSDKATYDFHIDVPAPLTAVANGKLTGTTEADGRRTFSYRANEPMATYLALVAIGQFRIVEKTSASGLPLRSVEPTLWSKEGEYLSVTEDMIDFFSQRFGPYPFESYGLLFTDSVRNLAMETQTISMFSAADMHGVRGDDQAFLAHELAHQWFGDAVSPIRWNDVWLNESFATYADWLWTFRDNPAGLERLAEENRRSATEDRRVRGSTGNPKPAYLFGRQVYNGGAIVLHALRREVGDDQFFDILQTWFTRYRYKSAGTEDFVAVATEIAQRDMAPFLTQWLDADQLPAFP